MSVLPSRHRLVVVALVAAVAATLLPASAAPAVAAEIHHEMVLDIAFPTRRDASVGDTYHACRSGCARSHQASDIMGQKHWPLYSTVDGEVCRINDGEEDSYGRNITICGDDGHRYRYLHVNNDTPGTDDGRASLEHVYARGMRAGQRVARGQLIAFMGDSGNAEGTASHLHLDVMVDGVVNPYGEDRINPYPSLAAARARGEYPDGTAVATDRKDRVGGGDRVETAIRLAQQAFDTADTAIVAPATDPADALAAGPLAAQVGGPVLTTGTGSLDPRVADEVHRLGADTVVVVGGRLAGRVREDLRALGVAVDVIAGDTRFATAALVAERVWALTGQVPTAEPGIVGDALPETVAAPTPTDEPTDGPTRDAARLEVRVDDRWQPLDGAALVGTVRFRLAVAPDGIERVRFHLDTPVDDEPTTIEREHPYNLQGPDGRDVDTATFGDGPHALVAVIERRDGTEQVVAADFTVGEEFDAPADATDTPLDEVLAPVVDALVPAPVLAVSDRGDRGAAVLLDGATVTGVEPRIFLTGIEPALVEAVAFHVDDPDTAGDPRQVESMAPFDLAGSDGDRARPLGDLDTGPHTVTAVVDLRVGPDVTVQAAFDVVAAGTGRSALLALGSHPDPSRSWPDALLAGYHGAMSATPVLLTAPDALPDATAEALATAGDVRIVGGPAAVPDRQVEAIAETATTTRLAGGTRYGTGLAVLDDLFDRGLLADGPTWVTTGRNWPDALAAGPVAAARGEILALVDGTGTADDDVAEWLGDHADGIDRVYGVGGVAAITDDALVGVAMRVTG